MKIVHFLKHCDLSNGHVHVVVDLACAQASRGHDVVVASGGGAYTSFLELHKVRHVTIPQSARRAPIAVAAFHSLLRRENPTVVHAHMMGSAAIAYLSTRFKKIPLVTTMHNSFDRHSFLMRLGDAIVAVSESERRLLLSRKYDSRKLRVVYNGPIDSVRESLNPGNLVTIPAKSIISVCGLHGRKRVNLTIEAFAQLSATYSDWYLVIVGDGPDMQKLKDLSMALGVESRVIFQGHHPNPQQLLRQAAIFVNFADAEPFGLAVAEARASGCAIVVSDVGGMPEVVEHGRAGTIVSDSDPKTIARALRELIASPDKLSERRMAAMTGLDPFKAMNMASNYDSVYAEAVARFAHP
ncbi:N-acetyl-alpha-D-glucosaminyl L-malate synthase [Methylobacterium tardum]|nr:N-acetyl-alpha-D-glucosaminyl L-malate synthase [Methylobacterium tardum]